MARGSATQVTVGVILVAVGVLVFGQQQHYWPPIEFHRLWPLVLIVVGGASMARPAEDGRRHGFMLVLLGAMFLLQTYNVMSITRSWPLLLIAWGVSVIMGGVERREKQGKDANHGN